MRFFSWIGSFFSSIFGSKGKFDKDLKNDVKSAKDYYKKKVKEKNEQNKIEKDAEKEIKNAKKEIKDLKHALKRAPTNIRISIQNIISREEDEEEDEKKIASGEENPEQEEQDSKIDKKREEENLEELERNINMTKREGDEKTSKFLEKAEDQSEKNIKTLRLEEKLEEDEEDEDQNAKKDLSKEIKDERDET